MQSGATKYPAADGAPSVSSSSLDHLDLIPQSPGDLPGGLCGFKPTLSESFRHSGWADNRQHVYDSLRRTVQSVTRIAAFVDCGIDAYVLRSPEPPYKYRLAGSHCHDRFCVPCSRDRSRIIAANVAAQLGGKPCRFLTLTLKQTRRGLRDQLDRITDCFSRLRQTKLWKSTVVGGCAFIEIKWSNRNEDWNVHIHCIIHGRYLPHQEVSKAWYRITKDSLIADVRFVRDNATASRYVTKYASKPFNQEVLSRPELLDQLVLATHRKRLVFTYGDWRGMSLTAGPTDEAWSNLGHIEDIAVRAKDGEPEAMEALTQIFGSRLNAYLASIRVVKLIAQTRSPPPNNQLTFVSESPHLTFFAGL